MSKVTLRPSIAADLPYVIGEPLPIRIRAITAIVNNRVIGMGGVAFPPDGPAIAFVQLAPTQGDIVNDDDTKSHRAEARRYPIAFHRAGLMAMKMIRESDVQKVIATADVGNDIAVRWLKRLGFKPSDSQDLSDKIMFVWRRET